MRDRYNFVIVSMCFPPMADPESYCTARFASALVSIGHNVVVVTTEHARGMSQGIYDKLVDSRVKVITTPASTNRKRPFWPRIKYFDANWAAADFDAWICHLKQILKTISDPILITRSQPVDSLIVGWHCRKLAKKWIVHISDPMPNTGLRYQMSGNWLSPFAWFNYLSMKFWVNRGLKSSDALSVTCQQVLRYFKMMYPRHYERLPHFVTTHIGDYKFRTRQYADLVSDVRIKGKVIAQPGQLFKSRMSFEIIDAVERLNNGGCECTFLHSGDIDKETAARISRSKYALSLAPESIVSAAAVTQRADLIFIPNYRSNYGYGLCLMSKFVYQVYEDKVIVVCDYADGPMHDYAMKYPEAGIFWADITRPETLQNALKLALQMDPATIDRSGIREEFSAENIAHGFEREVKTLLNS